MAVNREEWTIKNNEQLRSSTGLFGKFHRMLTLSDPYEIEIKNSRQVIGTMQFMRQFLEQAKQEKDPVQKAELINKARRVLGMRIVTPELIVSDAATETQQRIVRGTEHFDVEQKNIDVSRDVALDVGVTAATLGGGAVANLGRKGAQIAGAEAAKQGLKYSAVQGAKEGAVMGGVTSLGTSTGRNVDEVTSGDKKIGDAVQDVISDTAKGTVMGAGLGAGFGIASKGVEKGVERMRAAKNAADEAAQTAAAQGTKKNTSRTRERPQERAKPEQETKANSNPRSTEEPKGKVSEDATRTNRTRSNPQERPGQRAEGSPFHPGESPEAYIARMQEELMGIQKIQSEIRAQKGPGIHPEIQQLEGRATEIRASILRANTFSYQKLNPRDPAQKILGLQNGYSQADLQKAYGKMSQKYHPDHYPSDFAQARIDQRIINAAFNSLKK
ncbi:MAG: J domain-containing protein [Candidatus Peribacteraceae bacterium]|nr:J domain-containing protein [Candidatus Peribacteraceae bacterium]